MCGNTDRGLVLTDGWMPSDELKKTLTDLYMEYVEMFMRVYDGECVSTDGTNLQLLTLKRVIEGL